jgi:hypothetical protein
MASPHAGSPAIRGDGGRAPVDRAGSAIGIEHSLSGRRRKANRDLLRFILSIRAAAGRVLTRGRRTILAIAGTGETALDLDIYDSNGSAAFCAITWEDLLICFPLDAVEITHAELAARTDEWRRP